MATESLSGLVEQLSKEMKECMKEIVPRVLLVETTNTGSSTANNASDAEEIAVIAALKVHLPSVHAKGHLRSGWRKL